MDHSMSESEAYRGVTVDHLYQTCPNLQRSIQSGRHKWDLILGAELAVEVDPNGTDICGWCRRKWAAQ